MKAQERFDKILIAAASRIQDEVTALIGKPFKLGAPQTGPIDKETLFADLGGKQVLAHVRLDGDIQGEGCMLVGIKDAIQIGGTLIMLPEGELASVVAEQQYSDELQDSYGEVANIICGAATVTFEEQYTKAVRLIRTEQELILPAKVDICKTARGLEPIRARFGTALNGRINHIQSPIISSVQTCDRCLS